MICDQLWERDHFRLWLVSCYMHHEFNAPFSHSRQGHVMAMGGCSSVVRALAVTWIWFPAASQFFFHIPFSACVMYHHLSYSNYHYSPGYIEPSDLVICSTYCIWQKQEYMYMYFWRKWHRKCSCFLAVKQQDHDHPLQLLWQLAIANYT